MSQLEARIATRGHEHRDNSTCGAGARATDCRKGTIAWHAAELAARARLLRRPRFIAGSTLGLAGAGTALVLALGVASSPPAFAVTTNSNGSVTVQISQTSSLPQANAKLLAMGINEQVTVYMATGPAAASGAVACTPAPGASVSGPPIAVLVGTDGTEVINAGQTADNTGEGTWHLARCTFAPEAGTGPRTGSGTGNTGNTGAG